MHLKKKKMIALPTHDTNIIVGEGVTENCSPFATPKGPTHLRHNSDISNLIVKRAPSKAGEVLIEEVAFDKMFPNAMVNIDEFEEFQTLPMFSMLPNQVKRQQEESFNINAINYSFLIQKILMRKALVVAEYLGGANSYDTSEHF
mmetsp:Transcript_11939/g.18426  ORF Transcript_11939/g.18426 Transcript_11939/m.18426 type:complete len:145 (+) Transcript_11939:534-968(+)